MELHFTKMQGAGNDYVYVNGFEEKIPESEKPALARRLSDRHYGIGSDGLIFINPSDRADFEMEMYNADGSRGEMCGNGMRCVGKYVYDHGMTAGLDVTTGKSASDEVSATESGRDRDSVKGQADKVPGECFTVESFGVVHQVSVQEKNPDGTAKLLQVNMGKPILEPAEIPVVSDRTEVIDEPVEVNGQTWRMTCVSMGNPHAVVFVPSTEALDLEKIGPLFEHHPRFPKRVNTEFVQVLSDSEVKMRVWERGSGETLACGTGCCAVAVACVLNGKTKEDVVVHVPGGELRIRWDQETKEVWMTGPAETAFEGTVRV